MKRFRKTAVWSLVVMMLLGLTACGSEKENTATKAPEKVTEKATASTAAQKENPQTVQADKTEPQGSVATQPGNEAQAAGSKVLVAYFSATGTTKKLAEYAAEVTGADLYEIVPAEPYSADDLNYNDRSSRTSIEMNDISVRPAIVGSVADMGQYEIVFVAYPIWWGDAPRIIDTFMESYDFSGKTLVPFCTSASSGIGASAKELHSYTDSSVTWLDGERLKSGLSKDEMASWIRGLSLGIEVK